MRLYTTTGASQVDDPEFGTFTPDANGAFDGLPDGMYAKLHGRPGWENDPEREQRITREELDKFRDPAELLKAVKELGANQGILASALASALGITQPAAPVAPAEPAVPVEPAVAADPAPAEAPAAEAIVETPAPAEAPESPVAKPTGRRGKAAASAPLAE